MSNNKKKFRVFLLLIVAGFCIISMIPILGYLSKVKLGVQEIETPEPLEVRLIDMASRYQNGEISVIDISSITTFTWDRLYFFGSYTSSEEIDAIVGESWAYQDSCSNKVLGLVSSDTYTLLIFTNKNVVVHCLAHPNGKYPFGLSLKSYGKPGFSPQEALFAVNDFETIVLKDEK